MTQTIAPVRGEEFPRVFTAGMSGFGDWSEIGPKFEELERRGKALGSPHELEKWLMDQSELAAALDEEYSRRYVAMTCDTSDKALEAAYLDFIENIHPRMEPEWDKLHRLLLASPHRGGLDVKRYGVLLRSIENEVKLFREENVPLSTEDQKLRQQYQKICGGQTVTYKGEQKTLQQMAPYQEETDRAVREETWRLVAARRMEDRAATDEIFDEMIKTRTKIAANAGFANYRDYAHQAKGRFDYTPKDCISFQEAIESCVVPLLKKVRERRKSELGVEKLRPWDLGVDSQGRPPLRPFKNGADLEKRCAEVFAKVDGELGGQFQQMREKGLLDLESRIGKAPGGYQSNLEEIRYPFIFMNAAGTDRDVYTLLHEGGHAFHAFAARNEDLVFYRSAPIEFCEVASMTMELFAYEHLTAFYSEGEARRSRRQHTEALLSLFPWIATIDAFQHWLYLNPGHTRAQREDKWLELESRFSPVVDWSGLDVEHRSLWHRQLHPFTVPFYYVEYGIAQLGALQVWLNYKKDPKGAVSAYRRGLSLGGSRPLPELFSAAGAKFDFSEATVGPIMNAIERELAEI